MISPNGAKLFNDSLIKSEACSPERPQQKSFCFAPSNRFFYYKFRDHKLPVNLGPGSYNPQDQFKKMV